MKSRRCAAFPAEVCAFPFSILFPDSPAPAARAFSFGNRSRQGENHGQPRVAMVPETFGASCASSSPQNDPRGLPEAASPCRHHHGRQRPLGETASAERGDGASQGTETLREIIRHTDDLKIEALSIYAFSTENWKRSKEEVGALMQLILDFFASEIDELDEKNVRILILGDKAACRKSSATR